MGSTEELSEYIFWQFPEILDLIDMLLSTVNAYIMQ